MMAENSAIAWCDHTFNPWLGCSKVSPGCTHCYAENLMDTRYGRAKWGTHGTRVRTSAATWKEPVKWSRQAKDSGVRARVFCASLADVFEEWNGPVLDSKGRVLWRCECGYSTVEELDDCPRCGDGCAGLTLDDMRRDLFRMIDATPHLDWLVLTKRPENLASKWPRICFPDAGDVGALGFYMRFDNVWLGTSIESQDQAGRWKHLAEFRGLAPVLWVSAEPLLGPLDVAALVHNGRRPDWIVFGGESDQGAPSRSCDIEWIRAGVRQCRELGIVPFIKQLGSYPVVPDAIQGTHGIIPGYGVQAINIYDRAGADPDEWPEDLRVREFPEVKVE